jgi:Arc/MetJ-type ribon-helix-helix transcriptional regulator
MSIALPKELHDWAEAEVKAGRANSVDALALQALEEHRRRTEAFRASLEAAVAEADRDGWIEGDAILAEMDAMIESLEREKSPRSKR